MNVCSLNINGLTEKLEEVKTFLEEEGPDILFLQETKTRSSEFNERINQEGKETEILIQNENNN